MILEVSKSLLTFSFCRFIPVKFIAGRYSENYNFIRNKWKEDEAMTDKNNTICCATCRWMRINGYATANPANAHMEKPRGRCYCSHPEMEPAFRLIAADSKWGVGFITFTKANSDEPSLKTASRWCPIRLQQAPKEISKSEAYSIINNKVPQGLFYLKEEGGYTALVNTKGSITIEEFRTKKACLAWLGGKAGFECSSNSA